MGCSENGGGGAIAQVLGAGESEICLPVSWKRGLCFFAGKSVLDASIRHKPKQRNQYV